MRTSESTSQHTGAWQAPLQNGFYGQSGYAEGRPCEQASSPPEGQA